MCEQLNLFVEQNTLFNTGVQQLLDMNFAGSKETFQEYRRLFPEEPEPVREMNMALFWMNHLSGFPWSAITPQEAERAWQAWQVFESEFFYPWHPGTLEDRFCRSLFGRLARGLNRSADHGPYRLPEGTLVGLLWLLAGEFDAAIATLDSHLAREPEDARACAYLGDACFIRARQKRQTGSAVKARNWYWRAFMLGPEQVDVRRLADKALIRCMEDLKQDRRFSGHHLAWLPAQGELEGFFQPLFLWDHDELAYWVHRYTRLVENHARHPDFSLIPTLFSHGMVLSNNAQAPGVSNRVDVVEVRRNMRHWQPDLFELHMEGLGKRRGNG